MESIKYKRGHLSLLDQTKLPQEIVYVPIHNTKDGWNSIKLMHVRGAPAIAIAGALSVAVEVTHKREDPHFHKTPLETKEWICGLLDSLASARPTAVNLFFTIDFLKSIANSTEGSSAEIMDAVVAAAEAMLEEDIQGNKSMGSLGADAIIHDTKADKLRMLTHCNTGSLATGGYGTALGVIRSLHDMDKLSLCYCTETRPYNQGARLTALELVHDKIPSTLITDSMAGALMANNHKGIDAIVVGADRIACNGDTANKIGTYALAVLAKYHGVKFYVVAPTTSLDTSIPTGEQIHIEERDGKEITHFQEVRVTPEGIKTWNPAFDVTPGSLITAIITDVGVVRPDEHGNYNLREYLNAVAPNAKTFSSKK